MKAKLLMALLCLCFLACNSGKEAEMKTSTVTNPIPLKFGDPFLLHASDGRYYMYGTSLGDGFEAFVSDDLIDWDSCGQVYKGGAPDQWNLDCFWAPEVYERGGKYYLFYSSNYRKNPTHEGENFKIGVAVSDSPTTVLSSIHPIPSSMPTFTSTTRPTSATSTSVVAAISMRWRVR